MSHTKRIQAVKIKLDTVISPEHTELGIYSETVIVNTNMGANVIEFQHDTDYLKCYIGQRFKLSAGMPSATIFYSIVSFVVAGGFTIGFKANIAVALSESDVTLSAESEMRWSENALAGTAAVWTTGIIAKNGLGAIKESADLARGGAPVAVDGFNITVVDTNQLFLRLGELGIKLPGLTCELYEFVGTEGDSDATEVKKLFTGTCEDCLWSETILQIPVKNNAYKRRALMGTVINNCPTGGYPRANDNKNGQIVPLTYGKFYPDLVNSSANQLAKFTRTSETPITMINDNGSGYCDPRGASIFPCIFYGDSASPHLSYEIQLGTEKHGAGIATSFDLSEKYLQVMVGGSSDGTSFVGKYRKIVKSLQLSGTTTNGSHDITGIADTTGVVLGTKLRCSAGFSSTDFDLVVESISPHAISVNAYANASGATTVYQGVYWVSSDAFTVTVVLESFFEKDLVVSSDAMTTHNVWVQIVDIPFEYSADTWPCQGFLDEMGVVITSPDYPRLAVYDSNIRNNARPEEDVYDPDTGEIIGKTDPAPSKDGFIFIPNFGYSISSEVGANKFKIDLKLFRDSPDKMSTFSIFPLSNMEDVLLPTLTKYGLASLVQVTDDSSNQINMYSSTPRSSFLAPSNSLSGIGNVFDKNDGSCCDQNLTYTTHGSRNFGMFCAYKFDLPKTSIIMDYDKFYVGVKMKAKVLWNGGTINGDAKRLMIFWERFVGAPGAINDYCKYAGMLSKMAVNAESTVDNLPDFYYLIRGLPDNNKAFYFELDKTLSVYTTISGNDVFAIGDITSNDLLNAIDKMVIISGIETEVIGLSDHPLVYYNKIYELALICEKTISIAEDIWAMFSGRVFNDTWGSRKTATDLIQDPAAIFEHICRLQNWQEVGDLKIYGKEYCPNAKIKLSGAGSFDSSTLDALRALRPAFQIFDVGKSWTDEFKKAMCERYFSVTRQDEEGNECLEYLDPQNAATATPDTTITFKDLIGDIGDTVEPKAQDVFVEPFVNYAFNSGSSLFDKQLRILNTADADWIGTGSVGSPQYAAGSGWHVEYTPGFQGTDGEAVWVACNALWKRFRSFESPPADKTDCKEIVLYVDALYYIKDWIAWMGKRRVPVSVPYTLVPADGSGTPAAGQPARDWYVGKKIYFNNPHRTNGWNIKCLIESIEKDKNKPPAGEVKVGLILLEDIPTAFFLA
jgi:hypothetical protein